ncbi:MAG: glycosyltransferase family 4 protein [Candidatus Schekmanbacteria bacterium]|nr:glycosyltransferase family 4 protein [Candidatus Schekmanbacteria bacterium]
MKICVISPYYPPHVVCDGIADYTEKLCRHMAQRGHRIIVLASIGYKASSNDNDDSIHVNPFVAKWDFRAFLKLLKLCRQERFDAVNLQYSPPLYGFWFKLLFPLVSLICPTTVTFHTLTGGGHPNKLIAPVLALFCSHCISANEEVSYLIKKYLPWENPVQIPIGSNIDPVEIDPQLIRQKYNPENKLILTHFGLFYPGKGVETILEAAQQLKTEFAGFKLFMLGERWPGKEDYYLGLQQKAKDLGLDEWITWAGYLHEKAVSEYLAITDIMLLPYDQGASIRRGSLIAALSAGLPVITTYPAIPSVYIQADENIAVVPSKNSQALKDKILALANDPAARKRLGENARRLSGEFSWDNIAQKTLQLLEGKRC